MPYEVKGLEESWCRPKPVEMRHGNFVMDPIPESRKGIKKYDIQEKLIVLIEEPGKKSKEFV